MGRHSSPERGPFLRSILAWTLPWILFASVALVGVWVGFDALGGETGVPEVQTAAGSVAEPPPAPPSDDAEKHPSGGSSPSPRATPHPANHPRS